MSNNWISPREYFYHIVEPTVREYWSDGADHHKECAVFQLSSFLERYFWFYKAKGDAQRILGAADLKEFGAKISEKRPECGLLRDAADAAKHQLPNPRTRRNAHETTATGVWDATEYLIGDRWVTIHEAINVAYKFWRDRVSEDSDPPASK